MGIVLSALLYSAYLLFLGRIGWRIFLLARKPVGSEKRRPLLTRADMRTLARSAADILLLSRLFKSNPCLWLWEWLFHASFVFVMVRHLRYIMEPAPFWLASYQTFGICSGYALAVSLFFVFTYKIVSDRATYISSYNFFILTLVILISLTGILMRTTLRVDVTSVKYFILGALTFKPVPAPESITFLIHYITSLILLVFIPTHIFTAPYTIMEARKREDALRLVMHEK